MRTNEITAAFTAGAPVIDSHKSNKEYAKIDALIELSGRKLPLVGWSAGHPYQSLNAINMKNGELVLLQLSVGGTIIGETLTDESIRVYNESITSNDKKVSSVLFRDGRILEIDTVK